MAIVPPGPCRWLRRTRSLLTQLAPTPYHLYAPMSRSTGISWRTSPKSGWTPQVFLQCHRRGQHLLSGGQRLRVSTAKTDVLNNSQVKLLHLKDRLCKLIYMAYRRDEEQPLYAGLPAFLSSSGPGAVRLSAAQLNGLQCPGWDPMVPSALHADPAGRQTPADLRSPGEGLHCLKYKPILSVLNGVSEQEFFLHQAYGVGPLVSSSFMVIFDGSCISGNHHIPRRSPGGGLFDLLRQSCAVFFNLAPASIALNTRDMAETASSSSPEVLYEAVG